MPPCWSRRPAPARPRACRWCCSTSRGRRTRKSWCWSRAGSPRAPRPRAWRRRWASRSARRSACACASARRCRSRTRIEVVTEGVFTRLILDDPSLDGVAAVLFDEFHERSLDADLGLALARDAQQGLREDLKLLVMSATLDGARVAALLGDAPVIESEGRAFPVETRYLGRDPRAPIERQVADAVAARAARRDRARCWCSCRARPKSAAPRRCCKERIGDPAVDIVALYGALDARRRRTAPSRRRRPGRRKVVLATSIAETSLTIEGVRVVIDCGLVARAALRARCRPDAAGNRAGVARRRRPAPRPRRPHRARRLLPAVGRAADRLARALYAAGNPGRRSVGLRARSGAMGRRRSRQARVPRSAAAGRAQRSARRCSTELGAIDAAGPHHRRRPQAARAAAAAAACAHGGRCRRRKAPARARPTSPRS